MFGLAQEGIADGTVDGGAFGLRLAVGGGGGEGDLSLAG